MVKSEDYFNGFRDGLKEQKQLSADLLDKWRPDPSWKAFEVQRAAARIVREGKLPHA